MFERFFGKKQKKLSNGQNMIMVSEAEYNALRKIAGAVGAFISESESPSPDLGLKSFIRWSMSHRLKVYATTIGKHYTQIRMDGNH